MSWVRIPLVTQKKSSAMLGIFLFWRYSFGATSPLACSLIRIFMSKSMKILTLAEKYSSKLNFVESSPRSVKTKQAFLYIRSLRFGISLTYSYFCRLKLRKRSKLLRMNNDLLVEYVLGYELAIYRVFWSSAFCITSNNSFCIAKVLIFSHFTKNSQRKFPFYPHFR